MTEDDREPDRVAEAVGHVQAAALELIEAARAFLDVAEELVADPDTVAETVSVLGSVARAVSREARAGGRRGTDGDGAGGGPGTDGGAGSGSRTDQVERITLS